MSELDPTVEARKLAGLEGFIDDNLKGVRLRQATIVSYDSGTGLATIRLGGDTVDVPGVKHLASYTPSASDTGVWVLMNGADPLLIGALGGGSSGSPPGIITAFGGAAAPTGWLLCNGAAVSRTTYAALFTAVGTAYGAGDGSTTFNLPDLQDKFPRGKSGGSSLGGTGGATTDTIADDHTHLLNSDDSHAQFTWVSGSPEARLNRKITNGWTDNIIAQTVAAGVGGNINANGVTLGGSSDSTSVGGTVDTVPPYQVVNYIIKT